jgi:hypothetical protein
MASATSNSQIPPLRRPSEKVADPGKVRVGDTGITARFPDLSTLRRPSPKTDEAGSVRLGDTGIAAAFPLRQ